MNVIDLAPLQARATELREQFATAQPFPHLVVDNFLQSAAVDEIVAAISAANETRIWRRNASGWNLIHCHR